MSHSKLAAILFASSFAFSAHAQQWMQLMQDDNANFYDVQAAFNAQAPLRDDGPGESSEIFKRWEWLMEPRVYPTGELPDPAVFAKAVKDMRAMEHRQGAKSNANWTPIGPYDWLNGINGYNPGNGRVNCVFVDPIDATRIYVGTPGGGLWRSTDNGQTWSALFTDQPTLGVSGIAIDPTNTNIIYCATGDGDGVSTYSMGVIKSTDGGANWSPTGLSWTTTQARNMRALRMNPTDHNTLLCATSNGLWKTIDAGLNWTQVAQGSFHDVEYKPGDVNTVYACGDQFFRSTNGGDSFTQIISALPTSDLVNRMRIAVSAADPNKVYVLCGNSSDSGFLGLYRSNDSGLNFSLRSSSPNLFGYDDGGTDSGGQSGYDMAFTADPTNANNVFVGGVNVCLQMLISHLSAQIAKSTCKRT